MKHLYLGFASESLAMARKFVFSGMVRDLEADLGAIAVGRDEVLKDF